MIVASYGRAAATGQANWGLDDGFRITMERRAEPLCASRGATESPFSERIFDNPPILLHWPLPPLGLRPRLSHPRRDLCDYLPRGRQSTSIVSCVATRESGQRCVVKMRYPSDVRNRNSSAGLLS